MKPISVQIAEETARGMIEIAEQYVRSDRDRVAIHTGNTAKNTQHGPLRRRLEAFEMVLDAVVSEYTIDNTSYGRLIAMLQYQIIPLSVKDEFAEYMKDRNV